MSRAICVVLLSSLAGCQVNAFDASHRVPDRDLKGLFDRAPYPGLVPGTSAEPPGLITVDANGRSVARLSLLEAVRLSLKNNQEWLASNEAFDLQLLSLQVLRHG